MSDFTMTIDGKSVAARAHLRRDQSRHRRRSSRRRPSAAARSSTRRWTSASRAFRPWSRDDAARAARRCSPAPTRSRRALGELAPILTQEQGKPLAKASEELIGAAVWFQYTASLEIPVEVVQDDATARIEVRRRPLRRGRRDHAVELPGAARGLEDRAGAARREHDRAEAVAVHAALDAEARRDPARRAAARRPQRRVRATTSSAPGSRRIPPCARSRSPARSRRARRSPRRPRRT